MGAMARFRRNIGGDRHVRLLLVAIPTNLSTET